MSSHMFRNFCVIIRSTIARKKDWIFIITIIIVIDLESF